jgi:hypothetical protein
MAGTAPAQHIRLSPVRHYERGAFMKAANASL